MKNGFTLTELMLTVTILAIVIAIGAPSFSTTIKSNRLASQNNTVISALNYARSEAVKRDNEHVSICGSTDQSSCNTSNWESGWVIFADQDSNSTLSAGDTILRIGEPLSGGNTLRTKGFSSSSQFSFDTQGMLTQTGTFILCDDRGASSAIAIVINKGGQARAAVDENSPTDSIVNAHDGANITCP